MLHLLPFLSVPCYSHARHASPPTFPFHAFSNLYFAAGLLAFALFTMLPADAGTDLPAAKPTAKAQDNPVFGPFEAIALDPAYILGVKVDDAGKI